MPTLESGLGNALPPSASQRWEQNLPELTRTLFSKIVLFPINNKHFFQLLRAFVLSTILVSRL